MSNAIIRILHSSSSCYRCMALSVAIFVGTAREWIPDLIERAKALKVTGGFEEGADL